MMKCSYICYRVTDIEATYHILNITKKCFIKVIRNVLKGTSIEEHMIKYTNLKAHFFW